MVDINVTSPADNDIVSQYPTDERASRAALLALTSGTAWWGGTSGGSANAQTVTVDNTGLVLTNGLRVTFVAGFANTGAFTLQVNSLAATTVVRRNGSAPSANAIAVGDLVEVIYDGTNFRLLAGDRNYMDQFTYDTLLPVGSTLFRRVTDPPTVPNGVTATWTRTTTEAFVRIEGGTPTTGGAASFDTGSTVLSDSHIPPHRHKVFSNTEGSSGSLGITDIAAVQETGLGDTNYVIRPGSTDATHGETSATGGGAGHTHTVTSGNILHRSYAVWERTS